MSRAVFWSLLALLIYFALRSKLRAKVRDAARKQQMHAQQQPYAPPPVAIENMTSCAECGLHFPASEALHAGGHDYCSPAHVPAHLR
jgi:uncharacterized protein